MQWKDGDQDYELSGIICHKGKQLSTGHYYSCLKIDDEWWKFDDEEVSKMDKEITDEGDAYMLLYTKKAKQNNEPKN